jgi:para-nitrobenzyl esterase
MITTITNRACVLALCSCVAAACGGGGDEKPDPTRVKITDGEVQGSMVGTSLQFLGIPYAKPPVGGLRWKSPVKPDPWTTPRDATQFGKRCAQLTNATLQNQASNDEDCLYLNVWTPSPAPKGAPVMVWIHGGGNVNGSANEPVPFLNTGLFYSGEFLAEGHGVVVVSLNYRLGLFGFFAHADLVGEEGHAGNQGLQDQQLALQWVHDNIAKFGGDPGNVTIFGESAGSFDVCMHVASPASAGLFHRAISESGGCTTLQPSEPEAEEAAAKLAGDVGCTGPGALACLRAKSAADLMKAPDVAAGVGFGPHVDGWFMPDQPRRIYDDGNMNKVPYLLGSNTDEGTLFLPAAKPTTEPEYMAALTAMFGADTAKQVANVYSMTRFASAPNPATAALARVIGDSRLVCTTFDTAERMAAAGAPVFLYNFDIPVPAAISPSLGATHGSELTSVFGTSPTFASDPAAKAASDLIQRYWTNFARTGDPNGGADLKWPAFTLSANVRVNLALQPSVVTDFRAAECAFWQVGYAQQFPPAFAP